MLEAGAAAAHGLMLRVHVHGSRPSDGARGRRVSGGSGFLTSSAQCSGSSSASPPPAIDGVDAGLGRIETKVDDLDKERTNLAVRF